MTNNRTIFLAVIIAVLLFPAGTSAGDEIQIAAIFALTGPAAQVNRLSLIGANLAVQELNRTGGVLGRQVKLVEFDNQSTPIGSRVAAEQAAQLGATAIVGSAWSSHSMAVAQVAQDRGIPMVSNISTHPADDEQAGRPSGYRPTEDRRQIH